jgi:hypothetical protein
VRFETPDGQLVLQESCQGSQRECMDLVNRRPLGLDAKAVKVWSKIIPAATPSPGIAVAGVVV